MSKTKVTQCTCAHKAQDTLHGSGKRVHNETAKGTGDKKSFRCTVCRKER